MGVSATPSCLQERVIFNPDLLSDCICSMGLQKKPPTNLCWQKLRLLCAAMWEWEGEVWGGNPVGQQCPWCLCHENMPQVNYCPLTSIHAETEALHNHWRRRFLLQKMLRFELPKWTKEILSALHTWETEAERFVWGTQANFDRRGSYTQVAWINLCTTTVRLPFLSNIGSFSPWNLSSSTGCLSKTWFHFALFNKYASNSFLRQNCAASMPIQVAMLKLQMPQGPSGGFSRWDHQGQ